MSACGTQKPAPGALINAGTLKMRSSIFGIQMLCVRFVGPLVALHNMSQTCVSFLCKLFEHTYARTKFCRKHSTRHCVSRMRKKTTAAINKWKNKNSLFIAHKIHEKTEENPTDLGGCRCHLRKATIRCRTQSINIINVNCSIVYNDEVKKVMLRCSENNRGGTDEVLFFPAMLLLGGYSK